MADNPDVTWTQASAAVWSCLELNLGVALNSLVRLKPFVKHHFPTFSLSMGNYSSNPFPKAKFSGGPASWRPDAVNNSYQMNSAARKMGPKRAQRQHDGIFVTSEFEVDVDKVESSKHGSTDNILDPGPRQEANRAGQ